MDIEHHFSDLAHTDEDLFRYPEQDPTLDAIEIGKIPERIALKALGLVKE